MTDSAVLRGLSVEAWQQESLDPDAALARLRRRISELEPEVQALVKEERRFERLCEELARRPTGPLARVPIGVKDIFHVDGLETHAGSRLPAAELAGQEAECVTALKRAGGVVLGKTVSTEFAYFAPGPTRNPHNLGHTPGGSSSGSAAAVAAGYCPLALGTQTIGSITRPASFCGVVGYKPTYGRISLAGVIPLSPSLDHVGLFGNTVADAATAAAVLCCDWKPARPERRPILGVPAGTYLDRALGSTRDHFQHLCSGLESLGWGIRRADPFEDLDEIEARHETIMAAEFARTHQDWYARFGDLYHAKTRGLIEIGKKVSQTQLVAALEDKDRFREALEERTADAGIDLWISPAAPGAAPAGLEGTGDPVMNLPWTQAGLPTLSLPAGLDANGLPLGLQVAAHWSADEDLLAWGRELEEALDREP